MIQKDLQGNLWECKIGTMSSGKTFQAYQQEIERLNKELEVTTTNEETFRLEMQEITKMLGLDEHTIFDEVKDYVKKLVEENKVYSDMNNNNQEVINDLEYKIARLNNIINELEKDMNNYYEEYKDVDDIVISENARVIKIYLDKLKELKENK